MVVHTFSQSTQEAESGRSLSSRTHSQGCYTEKPISEKEKEKVRFTNLITNLRKILSIDMLLKAFPGAREMAQCLRPLTWAPGPSIYMQAHNRLLQSQGNLMPS